MSHARFGMGCILAAFLFWTAVRVLAADAEQHQVLSFYEMIARSEEYDGKRVVVAGVLSVEFEDNSLYASREAYESIWMPDSIYLALSDKQKGEFRKYHGEMVVVHGRFIPSRRASGQVNRVGTLEGITFIRVLEKR